MKKLIILSVFLLSLVLSAGITWLHTAKAQSAGISTHISLLNNGASPSLVSVKVGEYVQFEAKDSKSHIIAQGEGNENGQAHDHTTGGLESAVFNGDEAYKVQFNQAGVYNFHDHLHPNIVITVIAYVPSN